MQLLQGQRHREPVNAHHHEGTADEQPQANQAAGDPSEDFKVKSRGVRVRRASHEVRELLRSDRQQIAASRARELLEISDVREVLLILLPGSLDTEVVDQRTHADYCQ